MTTNTVTKADIALVKTAAVAAVAARDDSHVASLGLKDALIRAVGVPTAKGAKVWMVAVATIRLAVCGKLSGIQALKDSAGGKPPGDRTADEKMALVYNLISATASRMLSDLRAGKGAGKRKSGRKPGGVSTVKVTGTARQVVSRMSATPKALGATLRLVIASLQQSEGKGFRRLPELVASLQVAVDLL